MINGNLRRRINKPYDAEIEYLESTGTQWIGLGRTINSTTDSVDLDIMPTQETTTTLGIFGTRSAASVSNFSALLSSTNKAVIDVNNSNYATYRIMSSTNIYNKRCRLHIERSLREIYIDNVLNVSSNTTSDSFITMQNAYLFTIGSGLNSSIRVYSLKWKRGNALIMDFIPVRVGQVGYMYDKISGELFSNAGTGNFILGPDVNQVNVVPIEYLESTGTQYIDTLFKANTTNTKAEMKVYVNENTTQFICGSRNTPAMITNDSCALLYHNFGLKVDWATGSVTTQEEAKIAAPINTPLEISITRGTCIVNETIYTYQNNTSVNQNNTFYIFSISDSLTTGFKGRVYYFKLYNNNVLVMNLIPVRIGQIGYLFDKVSKRLFGNSGSGDFILGPDIT